jgi:glycolate oxidase iron-sulfur subunit
MDLAQQCVKCGLCLPHCPTYQLAQSEAESPRGRIALMMALADTDSLAGPFPTLDTCLGCRRCESACPADLAYDSLLIQTRAAVPPRPSWKERGALWLLAHKRALNKALRIYRLAHSWLPSAWRILPEPPKPSEPLPQRESRSAIFSGCVADTYEHNARIALQKLLQATGDAASIPDSHCCGQAALHAGRAGEAERLQKLNRQALDGYDRVLVLASGCFGALEHSTGIAVVDAHAYLLEQSAGLRFKSAQGLRVALHIPCTASFYGQQHAIITLLAKIPDLDLQVLSDKGCCGGAGLHQLAQPERAAQMRNTALTGLASSDVALLLSSNIGCRLHLAMAGGIPVRHPLEFMADYLP